MTKSNHKSQIRLFCFEPLSISNVPLGIQHCLPVLGTGKVQDRVIDGNQEVA
jgi:hypothetical protein